MARVRTLEARDGLGPCAAGARVRSNTVVVVSLDRLFLVAGGKRFWKRDTQGAHVPSTPAKNALSNSEYRTTVGSSSIQST